MGSVMLYMFDIWESANATYNWTPETVIYTVGWSVFIILLIGLFTRIMWGKVF